MNLNLQQAHTSWGSLEQALLKECKDDKFMGASLYELKLVGTIKLIGHDVLWMLKIVSWCTLRVWVSVRVISKTGSKIGGGEQVDVLSVEIKEWS